MSWDIYLETSKCPTCGNWEEIDEWGYTHNTNDMIRGAGFTEFDYEHMQKYDGPKKSAKWLSDRLAPCIENLKADPEKYRAMNPENGWGSYDTLVPVLEKMLVVCLQRPDAIVSASF